MDFVIHNAKLVSPAGVFENMSIGIEDGVIAKILVENAQPVEYNQPLFVIE